MAAKIIQKDSEKSDKLQLVFLEARNFVGKHRTVIYVGSALFLLVVLLSGGWYVYQLQYERAASGVYSRVFETAMKGSTKVQNEIIAGYKGLIEKYPRSNAAMVAEYRLANIYLGRRELDAAMKAYEKFLDKSSGDDDLRTLAFNGLGTAYELAKNYDKATICFEKALGTNSARSFEALSFSNIGRISELKQNYPKAKEYFTKALEKTNDPMIKLYLKRKIAQLG